MSRSTIKNVKIMPNRRGCSSSPSISKNRGFTLLESVIGFLILSIGLLGIASLQTTALKAGKTSVYASVAMMKAEEIIESMRINATALDDYKGKGVGENKSCSTVDCSPSALALDDLFWWGKNLTAGLPADTTKVNISVIAPTAGSQMAIVTVAISWDERKKDEAGNIGRNFTTTTTICAADPC